MNLLHTAHVPPGDGPFPTVIALHGWGANGLDLLGLAPILADGEALVICPQGPVEVPLGHGMNGYGWFPLDPGQTPDAELFIQGAEALRTFLSQAVARYPIDPRRTVLLGFSQGGAMAYELGLRSPSLYAGVAALSTWLPYKLSATIERTDEHARLPVFVLHGTSDPMVDIERGRESRRGLEELGVDLTYREIDMGHEINTESLHYLAGWLDRAIGGPETGSRPGG